MPETTHTSPRQPAAERQPPGVARLLTPRVTAALAALMLGTGVAVGAAIGPAPSTTFAGSSRLPLLLSSLLAAAGVGQHASAPAPSSPPASSTPQTSPAGGRHRRRHRKAAASPATAAVTPATSTAPPASTAPSSTTPSETAPARSPTPSPTPSGGGGTKTITPVTHVWLIELSGATFTAALAGPSSAPYITGQAIPSGTLLSSWSALAASSFANDTALLASTPPQVLDTIVQPPCPESTPPPPQCTPGSPAALTAADEFLKATLPTLTSSVVYREHGLVVVTFGTVASGSASGLPSGTSTATLTAEPPAGALLISPFATAGARPTTAFDPASPQQSIEKLLRR